MAEQALPESVQVRLMKMEYSSLSKEDIRTVYLEETGQEPPFDVTLYESEQFIDEEEAAGFNGTVIHIENEQGVNEAYTIVRGTEDFGDNSSKLLGSTLIDLYKVKSKKKLLLMI